MMYTWVDTERYEGNQPRELVAAEEPAPVTAPAASLSDAMTVTESYDTTDSGGEQIPNHISFYTGS